MSNLEETTAGSKPVRGRAHRPNSRRYSVQDHRPDLRIGLGEEDVGRVPS
jgi:hypothetical protein